MYRSAIDEGNEAYAMNNLATLVFSDRDGVVADPAEAGALYRRAVDEWNNVESTKNLALFL